MVSLKKPAFVLLSVFVVFALATSSYGDPRFGVYKGHRPAGPKFVPGEVIVKFKPGVAEVAIGAVHRRHGTAEFYRSALAGFRRARVPQGKTVAQVVAAMRQEASVEYAEPNYIATSLMTPSDPFYTYQWHMDNPDYGGIHMEAAWDIQTGDAGVVVAVIDTGVAYKNYGKRQNRYYKAPDLADTVFVPGYDFVENDALPGDDNSHGTHVAGTIAQSTNNGKGVAGVAFGTAIMPVKVLDQNGSGAYSWIADGIIWATDNGASVINLSLGGPDDSIMLKDAVAYAYNMGVTVIAAAGNDDKGTLLYPAAYDDYVIAVGATQYDENRAPYSNYGPSLDLVAPGGNVDLDQNGDGYGDGVIQNTFNPNSKNRKDFGYWFFDGTSMATPHVSGVAALLIAEGVAATPDQVREALQSTAKDKGPSGRDAQYGWGIVDASAALQWNAGPIPLQISTASLPDGVVGEYYSETVQAIGGTLPYTWSLSAGSLPDGLILNSSTGDIFGTLTAEGTSNFTVEVVDSTDPVQEADKLLAITVTTAPTGPTAHVTIDMSKKASKRGWQVTATAFIRDTDASGPLIEGATVSGYWSGDHTGDVSGNTDRKGKVRFKTPSLQGTGTVTFTVDSIVKDGIEYTLSGETSDSMSN